MRRTFAVLSLAASLSMPFAGSAEARSGCSCVTRTPQQHVSEATAVFSATVTNVRVHEPVLDGGVVTAELRADHVYKGDLGAEFEVFTKAQGPACGFDFVNGARYLVFARARDSRLTTTSCSGNLLLPAGDQPLRPSGEARGMEALTPELIAALGTPTRVDTEPSSARTWTGPLVIVVVTGAVAWAVITWNRTRPRAR